MVAVAPRTAWPDVVWGAALLRGLDDRARAEIAAAGRLRPLRPSESVYRRGDPSDVLFVVAEGACELVGIRRGEATASTIRRVGVGEAFGEEGAAIAFSTRLLDATAIAASVVAEIPIVVLRRAATRAGAGELLARAERAMRRAATLDLLKTTALAPLLDAPTLERWLDAARHLQIARGEHVYRVGDPSKDAYFVADGMVQAQTVDDGKPRAFAYLTRGDLFGDEELEAHDTRAVAVVAHGPSWIVAIPRDVFLPVARRAPARDGASLAPGSALGEGVPPRGDVRRITTTIARREVAIDKRLAGAATTAHVFRDLYRLKVARSLLVIDQDACVRCGHCASQCASVHGDGISRLVRSGDTIVATAFRSDEPLPSPARAAAVPLLVPNSCQHCMNPSCMIDCPTGAIGRDGRGEVFIREDLCTGCGSCAKACPWDNIQIAPRAGGPFPEVAVKCDLCKGVDGGPACVAACPADAIARIDPNAALVELRVPADLRGKGASGGKNAPPAAPSSPGSEEALAMRVLPPRASAAPWIAGAGLVAAGLALVPPGAVGMWTSGLSAGTLVVLLVAYGAVKRTSIPLRLLRRLVVGAEGAPVPLARGLATAHVALGVMALGLVALHGKLLRGGVPSTAAGSLVLALLVAIGSGIFGAVAGALVPRRLARIERKTVLPEELAARPGAIEAQFFAQLSGKSELTKTLFARVLRPYVRARTGPLALILSGRSLRDEERVVEGRLHALLGEGKRERAAGARDLVRLVVEHRAVRAQRLLTWLLRGFLYPHLAATVVAIVLLVVHVVVVARAPSGGVTPARSSPPSVVR